MNVKNGIICLSVHRLSHEVEGTSVGCGHLSGFFKMPLSTLNLPQVVWADIYPLSWLGFASGHEE